MTRINVGVHPSELPDRALLAEHGEITRIPNAVRELLERGTLSLHDMPAEFCLGKGHVKFFYNKLEYLRLRYCELYAECWSRGFDITDKSSAFVGLPEEYMQSYDETLRDREIILERIATKPYASEVRHAK